METLTNLLVGQMLSACDPTPVVVNKEEIFLACLVMKNLDDLCQTGQAVLNNLERKGISTKQLPDPNNILLCRSILGRYFNHRMIHEDPEKGVQAVWKEVQAYQTSNKESAENAYRIYRALKNNLMGKPGSKEIIESINTKNKVYFIQNFDSLFADVPFSNALNQFKNFLGSNLLSAEDDGIFWDFFQMFMEFFLNEQEILAEMRKQK